MNYDYSGSPYIYTSPRIIASPRRYVYEPYYEQIEKPIYYREEPSPYYLQLQNEELTNSLFYEKRALKEITNLFEIKKIEAEDLKRKGESNEKELVVLKSQYTQSEQIRQEQSKLIESLQSEIDSLREKLAEVELKEKETTEKADKAIKKNATISNRTASSNNNTFKKKETSKSSTSIKGLKATKKN